MRSVAMLVLGYYYFFYIYARLLGHHGNMCTSLHECRFKNRNISKYRCDSDLSGSVWMTSVDQSVYYTLYFPPDARRRLRPSTCPWARYCRLWTLVEVKITRQAFKNATHLLFNGLFCAKQGQTTYDVTSEKHKSINPHGIIT